MRVWIGVRFVRDSEEEERTNGRDTRDLASHFRSFRRPNDVLQWSRTLMREPFSLKSVWFLRISRLSKVSLVEQKQSATVAMEWR